MITCIHGIAAKRIIKYITLISVVSIDRSREWDRNDIFAKFISSSHNFVSVEIGNPISLCWGPAMIEKFVIGVFSFG